MALVCTCVSALAQEVPVDGDATVAVTNPKKGIIAVGYDSGATRFFRVDSLEELSKGFPEAHAKAIVEMAYSPQGDILATAGDDDVINIWDMKRMNKICTLRGFAERIAGLGFSDDGRRLVAGSKDGVVHVFSIPSGKLLGEATVKPGEVGLGGDPLNDVAFAAAPTTVFSVGDDGKIHLLDYSRGMELKAIDVTPGQLYSVRSGRRSGMFYTVSSDGYVQAWSSESFRPSLTIDKGLGFTSSVALSEEADLLAANSRVGISIYRLSTGKRLDEIQSKSITTSLSVDVRGKYLFGINDEGLCRWEVNSRKLTVVHRNAARK